MSVTVLLDELKRVVEPALRASVEAIADEQMRLIAGYQLGWNDEFGNATDAGGKAIRPALAVLSAQAVTGSPDAGIAPAVAVELVHNFSLLHDDVMDRDIERRHRKTGWVAFGEAQAILAGSAGSPATCCSRDAPASRSTRSSRWRPARRRRCSHVRPP
jgi:geranylgeranyl diphosphate synthase type I